MKIDINKLKDEQLAKLVDARWASSASLWDTVTKTYEKNTKIYQNEGEWIARIPVKLRKVLANRIFPNMEAVINSVIANPPALNMIPGRTGAESQALARKMEAFFRKKYRDLNVKEALRMGLRNLYFGRLIVIKVFWNPKINDFDLRPIDPRKVRFGKYARREEDSEFAIEEIEDNICSVLERFPKASQQILKKHSFQTPEDAYINNKDVKYMEAWIGDYVIFKMDEIILDVIRNPYFDWDGILITEKEEQALNADPKDGGLIGEPRRDLMARIKIDQDNRKLALQPSAQVETNAPQGYPTLDANGEPQIPPNEGHSEPISYKAYNFNYFNQPRKPYVYSTILNNENQPIGRTDFITMAETLQESIDKRKQDIGQNCELVNGIIKVDAEVMDKESAQQLAYEAKGVIWGKGVAAGVTRETGATLPEMVYNDMLDSRNEIDNIMAASSAFRGEREGQETKAGRLALIQQSFLRLNELVQCVDFVSGEVFSWFFQLAKTRYTERHYAKWIGKDEALEILDIIQDDFENGSEIQVIPGKTLPEDAEFRFERAQKDVAAGILSPVDYMEEAGYTNPKDLARNAVLYKQNPAAAVGLAPEKMPLPAQPGTLQPDQELAVFEAMGGMQGLMGGGSVTPASAVAP